MLRGGKKDSMIQNEGDFGLTLGIRFSDMQDGETIKVVLKQKDAEEAEIFNKDFTVESGKIDFKLNKEETEKLKEGDYLYDMIHYRDDVLYNTILVDKDFIVEEGAKHGR